MPVFEREETFPLRCVETDPRHLSLLQLEPGDCRYPYGGDAEGEAITSAVDRVAMSPAIARPIFV